MKDKNCDFCGRPLGRYAIVVLRNSTGWKDRYVTSKTVGTEYCSPDCLFRHTKEGKLKISKTTKKKPTTEYP